VVATSVWLAAPGRLLQLLGELQGRYNETYGALAAVVVVMLWLYIGAYVAVAGAELNADLERQTRGTRLRGPRSPGST
jgi:membrane protein